MESLQGADGILEPDLSRVSINVKHIGWLCVGDGVVDQVVWLLRILVCSLGREDERITWGRYPLAKTVYKDGGGTF